MESNLIPDIEATDVRLFHSNQRYSFCRASHPTGPIVIKSAKLTPQDAHAAALLRREFDLLDSLALPGVVNVLRLVQTESALAMVMADAGQQNLAAHIAAGPLGLAEFWEIALQLARAVAGLHGAGIVHRNLNPANVVRDTVARTTTLVDFQVAVSLSTPEADRSAPPQLETSLAYMAPEQTGRTGRSPDWRSDLYSLGATLYALLTGAPPFTAQDPVELVHAHLARSPKPPHTVRGYIPRVLSDILLKLLEKEPEQRYLTADGLLADLKHASEQWSRTQTVAPFPLAESDVPRQIFIPGKLYGRSAETRLLRDAFDRVARSQRELVFVTGAPGIGKSALVAQLEHAVADCGGYYIQGKFDQLERSVPYGGLVQAFRMLIRQLLTQPDKALALWRERIQAAVTPNAQILVDVIPEIESILGPQAPVAALGPVESKNRFNQVFRSFLNVLARPEHPIVVFLDDLQWADTASIELLQHWIADGTTGYLLIVGAYRDEEVGLAHPLARALAELRKNNVRISEIHIGPLAPGCVAELVADTLGRPQGACGPLCDVLVRKTAGNPFFIRRLLHALHGEGLIHFVPQERSWAWDLDGIERAPVSDNVLHLMSQAIGLLPEAARSLLQAGACIGHRFELGTLAAVTRHSPRTALRLLRPALAEGLLLPVRDAYRAPAGNDPAERHADAGSSVIQFVHDRVQQAAYMSLPATARCVLHLDIGRHLQRLAANDSLDARLFDIVDQLDRGESLIQEADERWRLAELNLAAGRKAKTSAAYQAAFDYLAMARHQLDPDAWNALPGLTFDIYRELAECAYLTGRHAEAEQVLETALGHASSKVAKADLYGLRVLAATVAGDWAGALHWGREGLAVFGHEWPLDGLAHANDAECAAVIENLGARRTEDLIDEAEVVDPETQACMHLLSILGPPAYFCGSEVLTFLVARSTNLSLLHGPSVYSAYAYVFYGAIHNARTGRYDVGHAFGKLALALAQRFDNRAEESRTLEVFSLIVHVWRAPVADSLALMHEGHRAGVESGELAYAAFNLCGILINGLPAGVPLGELLKDADISIAFATQHQNRTAVEISVPFRQFALVMTDQQSAYANFDAGGFDQARYLEDASGNQTAIGHYWVLRLQAAYRFGDIATARHCALEGAKCISTGILGMITSAEHAFYATLTAAAAHSAASPDRAAALLDEVHAGLRQLDDWSEFCPANFLHKKMIVEAELERLTGSAWKAMELFGEAIDAAQRSGFIQDGALANELAGKLFLAHKQPRIADVYLQAAITGYRNWGASAKVRMLEGRHPDQGALRMDWPAPFALDALGLIKASQAIAAETVQEQLLKRILHVVVEVAGAQTGALLLGNTDTLRVSGRILAEQEDPLAFEDAALADCEWLPRSIIRYVARMKEPLVLDDAAAEGPFAMDAEVKKLSLRSVLCVPLTKHLKLVGVLYLENNTMASAFTAARVQVVQALTGQAAISLENSTLLQERDRTERELRQLAHDLADQNRRKTVFLATLAHELRNPLAPIRTGLDLLRMSGHNPAAAAKVHEMMGRQLNQMVRLIDDLLDIARINTGKVQLEKERVDLRDAIAIAVEATLPAIKSAQHKLDVAIPDEPLVLDADPTRLTQILSNLLTNAVKYTTRGGQIGIVVKREGGSVTIAISDTGIGIPPEALPEVFSMFSQVSKNMGRSQGGLGIGLSLVRSLVQMHGGEVDAASAGEGQGSTFTVRLPLAAAPADAHPPAPAAGAHARPGQHLKILVADDNVDAANMVTALLEAGGHEVEVVHNGIDAVGQARTTHFDLAILDIGMPGLDGYEVAEAIRQLPGKGHMYLAALTGWGAEEDRNRSRRAGFDAHLTKPAGSTDLDALIEDALSNVEGQVG
jgi:predicted ATPase/signal transduction histidine kinase/ActR/RegA family two-component response regulator